VIILWCISYYKATKVSPSVCLSVCSSNWGKNRRTDENGKGTMGCGLAILLLWGSWLGFWGEGKGETQETCFSAGRAVYIQYFKDIHQRTLQSDCVMLFGGLAVWGFGLGWGLVGVWREGAHTANTLNLSWNIFPVMSHNDHHRHHHVISATAISRLV